jgi:hypothetical protein
MCMYYRQPQRMYEFDGICYHWLTQLMPQIQTILFQVSMETMADRWLIFVRVCIECHDTL